MQENSSTKEKTAKRQGQIIKRGKTYLVRVFLYRDLNGKKIYYNATIKGTRKDAEEHLTEYLQKKHSGKLKQKPSTIRFNEFVEDFFTNISNSKRRNREIDLSKARNHILPVLGHFKLKEVSSLHIENLYKDLRQNASKYSGKILSGTTQSHIHRILYNVFSYAVKRRMIIDNPLTGIIPPKPDTKEINTFSPDEIIRFLEAVENYKGHSNDLINRNACLFNLAVETGLRPEEYFALQWKDIDFGNLKHGIPATLQVRRVAIRMNNKRDWWFDEPKTAKSRRSIPLSNKLVDSLINQKLNVEKWKNESDKWKDCDLVFPNNLGEPHYPDSIRRIFKKLLKLAELENKRYSPYSLRHTCATLLLRANVHPKIVSERLGHSSITITLDIYSHCLPTMQETATNSLVSMIYKEEENPLSSVTDIDLTSSSINF